MNLIDIINTIDILEKLFASFCREVFKALPKVPVSNEKLEFTNPINNNNNEKPKHRFIPEIKNPILREMFAKYLKENPLETFLNAKDTHFVDELSIRYNNMLINLEV